MQSNYQASVQPSERIELIDVLRGFTLLGIIIAHFTEQYYAGQPPEKYAIYGSTWIVDQIVSGLVFFLITGKFFMIFSFLFGMSFFLQLNKSDGPDGNRGTGFPGRFTWRLVILALIGFVHHLHYRGDILMLYAALGIGLLVSYKLPDKLLLIVALLLVFNLPAAVTRVMDVTDPASKPFFENADQKKLEAYYETIKSGSYSSILNANLYEFKAKIDYQVWSGRLYVTFGLFLLGLYAGKKNLFGNVSLFKNKLIWVSLGLTLGSVVLVVLFFGGLQMAGIKQTRQLEMLGGLTFLDLLNAGLALMYVSGVIFLFQQERWKKRLMIFYTPGRMGLSTYLMQTLAGTLLYYSYGLALIGEFGAATAALIGINVFVLQILFSKWWFRNFQYGPIEWLWRSLTYLKIQPMSNRSAVKEVAVSPQQ